MVETAGEILIVGEIPDFFSSSLPLLIGKGYTVHSTIDTLKALEIAVSGNVDTIVLSTGLREPSAYTLCEKIKTMPEIAPLPIIFLAHEGEEINGERIFQVGGADYLGYGIKPVEIAARIENQLSLVRLQKNLSRQSRQLEETLTELQQLETSMERAYSELREASFLDGLTRVANRRRFEEYLDREWRRCLREQRDAKIGKIRRIALILCSIDYFHHYNDRHGLAGGDSCLQKIALALQDTIKRPADLVARYGGKSFAILLPDTDETGAMTVAGAIRREVAALALVHGDSPVSEYVTLSYGVAAIVPEPSGVCHNLIDGALKALEKAEREGYDRIALASTLDFEGEK